MLGSSHLNTSRRHTLPALLSSDYSYQEPSLSHHHSSLSTLPLPLTRILPIIFGHLLDNLPCLFDIAPVMDFTTVRLNGIGPSSGGLDGVFSAGTEMWGCSDQLLPVVEFKSRTAIRL